jgi:hypothetical protein
MDQQASSQPLPSSSTTDNPVVALGQKVKAAFTPHERPSVRILRERSAKSRVDLPRQAAPPTESEQNMSATGIGAKFRSMFSREENATDRESSDHEYDRDTVDLLDVMGMYSAPHL